MLNVFTEHMSYTHFILEDIVTEKQDRNFD